MRNIENGKFGKECVITDMGLSRIFDLNKTYQTTKAATFPLKASKFILYYLLLLLFWLFLDKIHVLKSQNFDYS